MVGSEEREKEVRERRSMRGEQKEKRKEARRRTMNKCKGGGLPFSGELAWTAETTSPVSSGGNANEKRV